MLNDNAANRIGIIYYILREFISHNKYGIYSSKTICQDLFTEDRKLQTTQISSYLDENKTSQIISSKKSEIVQKW